MDAVGADGDVGLGHLAIGEGQFHHVPGLRDPGQLVFQADDVRRHDPGQHGVQIAAMHQQIGNAIPRLDGGAEFLVVGDRAGVMIAAEVDVGLEGRFPQLRPQTQAEQHAQRIGRLLDARAEAGEAARLFVDAHIDADAAKTAGGGGGQDAHDRIVVGLGQGQGARAGGGANERSRTCPSSGANSIGNMS